MTERILRNLILLALASALIGGCAAPPRSPEPEIPRCALDAGGRCVIEIAPGYEYVLPESSRYAANFFSIGPPPSKHRDAEIVLRCYFQIVPHPERGLVCELASDVEPERIRSVFSRRRGGKAVVVLPANFCPQNPEEEGTLLPILTLLSQSGAGKAEIRLGPFDSLQGPQGGPVWKVFDLRAEP